MPITITPGAAEQARALGVTITPELVRSRMEGQDPPISNGHRTYRLGRPSRARIVVEGGIADGVVIAVLPSSPHIDGPIDRARGSADRKRERDQARWERRQATAEPRSEGRPRIEPAGTTEGTHVRLGAERQARAAARAAADGISLAELLRRAVDVYLDRGESSEQGQPPRK